ncbi:hypothetical protein [Roseovarius pelagicus]|uniref:Aerotolerance regulator N-terminal domain-containing protein n=1 Tax=Roseovarius pelagicus TaxID=2980108 RepID=A0ABY6DFS0_9RHOB|nr:hypothetical protein [Roseovarius pelagicus]UXX83803.1 hypothetical protein N7U68_03845 [Roseovarius pelagicus]
MVALGAVIGFHMVRPNYRDIRVSVAHLMPVPPESHAPKRKFSLRNLIVSLLFWLRLAIVGLVALALFPMSFAVRERDATEHRHLRIVLDVSGSMGVGERVARAADAVREAVGRFETEQGGCLDMVVTGPAPRLVEAGSIGAVLAELKPDVGGQPVAALFGAIGVEGPCGRAPSHVVVVSDLAARIVPEARHAGYLVWYQIGEPADNLAIWDVRVNLGALHNRAPELVVEVAGFGVGPGDVTVAVEGPGGRSEVALRRDEERIGGWIGVVPYAGSGRYQLKVVKGGALALDDHVEMILGDVERVAVDWRLANMARPGAFAPPTPDASAIVVAPYGGPGLALPKGPFVLTYAGWPNPSGAGNTIGPFMQDHPVLNGVNFDVLETNAPRAIRAPDGFRSIIRPDASGDVWLAERQSPRGVIVPDPSAQGSPDVRALARLMFYNALSWVAQEAIPAAPVLQYVTMDGEPIAEARAESDTARALAPAPTLAALDEPPLVDAVPPDENRANRLRWEPWLFAFGLLLLLAERAGGLVWGRGNV